MANYKTIPVDYDTYHKLLWLCDTYDLGHRAQGAIVRRLVNAEIKRVSKNNARTLSCILETKKKKTGK